MAENNIACFWQPKKLGIESKGFRKCAGFTHHKFKSTSDLCHYATFQHICSVTIDITLQHALYISFKCFLLPLFLFYHKLPLFFYFFLMTYYFHIFLYLFSSYKNKHFHHYIQGLTC